MGHGPGGEPPGDGEGRLHVLEVDGRAGGHELEEVVQLGGGPAVHEVGEALVLVVPVPFPFRPFPLRLRAGALMAAWSRWAAFISLRALTTSSLWVWYSPFLRTR